MRYIFILLLLFSFGCQKKEHNQEKNITSQKPISIFTLSNGKNQLSIKIENNHLIIPKAKRALLFFFTSSCPACKAQLEELKALAKKEPDVTIIGVLLDYKKVDAPFFVSNNFEQNRAFAKKVYKMLRLPANMPVPLLVLIEDGKYVIHYLGATPLEMIETDLREK